MCTRQRRHNKRGFLPKFQGILSDIVRKTENNYNFGEVNVLGTKSYDKKTLAIRFQNENLIATMDNDKIIVATVPDIISILDEDTGHAITTEELKFGQRVSVICIPCNPMWRRESNLEVAGPKAFGYKFSHVPVGKYVNPKPMVIPASSE